MVRHMVMKYDKSVLFNILTSIYGKLKSILIFFMNFYVVQLNVFALCNSNDEVNEIMKFSTFKIYYH